ncbi:PREDICTED: uncharacterized protein LOC109189298 [Ipomoea nil]|uniref:uncharacterized protein LOC109189298 n=1 Tax=Ipomoea nil TaxID=35883 RepID=UPI0009013F69|nr:PREDICTED: uncharacterized protein LOC109189298 [Ipomoea nil]
MRYLLRFAIPGSAEKTFGGKTVVLGGDFRQILLVFLKVTRPIVVGATINSSYFWTNCKVMGLAKKVQGFEIDISTWFLLKCGPDPIVTIVESTFPSARYDMLDESHLEVRAILSPTLDVVDQINQYMCDMNTAGGRT